jgi:hypothetical protein
MLISSPPLNVEAYVGKGTRANVVQRQRRAGAKLLLREFAEGGSGVDRHIP